jgi:DNA modification methylase
MARASSGLFFDAKGLRIYNDDFLTTKRIGKASIDLTVTSPPYSIDIKYGEYNDNIPYAEYLSFTEKWLGRCLDFSKPDGRLCLNIPLDKNKGGQQSVSADITTIAKKVGWKYHSTIIWNEQNISRRTAWGCVDAQTRIVTCVGLKYFSDLKVGDIVPTLNLHNGTLEYQPVDAVIAYPYQGKMFCAKTAHTDLVVTPNHRFVVRERAGALQLKEISEIEDKNFVVPLSHSGLIENDSAPTECFNLPPVDYGKRTNPAYVDKRELDISLDDWLPFLGIYLTDGNSYSSARTHIYRTSIYQTKPDYLPEITSLLSRLPFEFNYKKEKSEYFADSKRLTQYLSQFGKKNERVIPSWIMDLSLPQKKLFLEWLLKGDGCTNRSPPYLAISSEKMLGQVLLLLLELGHWFSVETQFGHEHLYKGRLFKQNYPIYRVKLLNGCKSRGFYIRDDRPKSVQSFDYVGWVYCASVKNQTILLERNGKFLWTGNSWLSASAPYVIAPVEVILVLYKEKWIKEKKGKSDVSREEFLEWTNGVWSFNGESRNRIGHPAPFPVELPRRCIKLFSYVGDTVLDPFLGSGTTLLACFETKRLGLGMDIDRKYCELAKTRIEQFVQRPLIIPKK